MLMLEGKPCKDARGRVPCTVLRSLCLLEVLIERLHETSMGCLLGQCLHQQCTAHIYVYRNAVVALGLAGLITDDRWENITISARVCGNFRDC